MSERASVTEVTASNSSSAVQPRRKRAMLRRVTLHLCRVGGLFLLARHLTRHELRILGYHGFSTGDEHEFQSFLYMRAETFRRRMSLLQRQGYPLVGLQEGIELLDRAAVGRAETVVTIDDGWRSTLTEVGDTLGSLPAPPTLYVTTYYAERDCDVFNVALQYLFWKARRTTLTVEGEHPDVDGRYDLASRPFEAAQTWIRYGERRLDWRGRQALLSRLAGWLGLDPEEALGRGRFRSLNAEEIRELHRRGVDIQLHTHRHRLPESSEADMRVEIDDNRARLEAWIGGPCEHFCYPSGQYGPMHPTWLANCGMRSATTCDVGPNDPDTPRLLLRRILDREDWADVEFEAEVSGFMALVRRLLGRAQTAPRDS